MPAVDDVLGCAGSRLAIFAGSGVVGAVAGAEDGGGTSC